MHIINTNVLNIIKSLKNIQRYTINTIAILFPTMAYNVSEIISVTGHSLWTVRHRNAGICILWEIRQVEAQGSGPELCRIHYIHYWCFFFTAQKMEKYIRRSAASLSSCSAVWKCTWRRCWSLCVCWDPCSSTGKVMLWGRPWALSGKPHQRQEIDVDEAWFVQV